MMTPLTRSCLSVATLATALVLLTAAPASAQQAETFYYMNSTLIKQMAAVPSFFKQVTVLVGLLTTYVGLHGFYKGAADPRSAAHLKNFFLLFIGGMFLSIGFLALSAERNLFGNVAQPEIRGSTILNSKMDVFN